MSSTMKPHHETMRMQRWTIVMLSLLVSLAGCTEADDLVGEEPVVTNEEPLVNSFPIWNGTDHANTTLDSSAFANRSYLAYFSAPWCAHCESTLDAYDSIIPNGSIAIFSMEGREEYANMSEWHNQTETNLNRTFDRPFILHPELAKEVRVQSIPHAVFVNAQGYAFHVEIGKETNLTYIQEVWSATETAFFSPENGWNNHINNG